MKHPLGALACAILLAACGREPSVASKSAAAYEQAPPAATSTDHSAHQHDAATDSATTGAMTAADHAAMGHVSATAGDAHAQHGASTSSTDHSAHGATKAGDHAAMTHDTSKPAAHAAGHSATASTPGAHATHGVTSAAPMDHSQHSSASTPPMDHTNHAAQQPAARGADPHAGHGGVAAPFNATAPRDLQRVEPAATLRSDPFDAPAPASVAEAARGAGGAAVDHGDHTAQSGEAEALYACPMHPEVTSATPGKCPKCGMTLVKRNKK